MRIPSGDLAPARRRGRRSARRRTRALPIALAVLLLGAGVGSALLLRRDDQAAADRLATADCPPSALRPVAARSPALPAPGRVRLRLLNGTARDGLGRAVGQSLAARGFGVASTGNAPARLAGASRVVFGPGARPAATLVAAHVVGATLVPAPTARAGALELVLGSGFQRLRTPAEVSAFLTRRPDPAPAARPARPASSAAPAASRRC